MMEITPAASSSRLLPAEGWLTLWRTPGSTWSSIEWRHRVRHQMIDDKGLTCIEQLKMCKSA